MFAVIWPLNFLALFVVGVWFTRFVDDPTAWRAIIVLGGSVVAALAWAWLFYVPHRLSAATLCFAAAAMLTACWSCWWHGRSRGPGWSCCRTPDGSASPPPYRCSTPGSTDSRPSGTPAATTDAVDVHGGAQHRVERGPKMPSGSTERTKSTYSSYDANRSGLAASSDHSGVGRSAQS